MKNYRIRRTDAKNIAIQRLKGAEWRTVSYHGNSLNSLIYGLFELMIAQHIPEQEKILYALEDIKLELVSGIEEVKEMIERMKLYE